MRRHDERFRRFAASFALCAAATLAGCFHKTQDHRVVALPPGAVAITPLANGRVAVLAGDDVGKSVYVVNAADGSVVHSFGVTREATGLAAAGANGPLLLTIGGNSADGHAFGAVERWTLRGQKDAVLAMPGPAMGVTTVVDGTAYALVDAGGARSAIPFDVATLRPGTAVGLAQDDRGLQRCKTASTDYLVYTSGDGTLATRDLGHGRVRHSRVEAENPECLGGIGKVVAIAKTAFARTIAVLDLPGLVERRAVPVSTTASVAYAAPSHQLEVLDSAADASYIEFVPEQQIDGSDGTQ